MRSLALSEHVFVNLGRPYQNNNQLNLNNPTFSCDYHHFVDFLRAGAGPAGACLSKIGRDTKLTNIIPQNIPSLKTRLIFAVELVGLDS